MYHAALRVGEICTTPDSTHTLQHNHIKLTNARRPLLVLKFQSRKHSTSPQRLVIGQPSNPLTCAFHWYQKYLRLRGHTANKAFLSQDGSPIRSSLLSYTLKRHLRALSLNPNHYNTHSFRFGRATDMAVQGYTGPQMSMVGKWKSDAYKRYIKPDKFQCAKK